MDTAILMFRICAIQRLRAWRVPSFNPKYALFALHTLNRYKDIPRYF